MSRLYILVIAIALSTQPTFANAQELWKGSTNGMSLDKVQQLFPAASEPKDPEKLANGRELLRVSPIEFCGKKVKAMLIFQKKKLNGVKFQPIDELNGTESEQWFKCMKTDLTAEFGTPAEDESRTYAGTKGKVSQHFVNWNGKGVRVVAVLLVKDEKMTILYVGRFSNE